jgi:uncharacterized protein (TIGR03118 family)
MTMKSGEGCLARLIAGSAAIALVACGGGGYGSGDMSMTPMTDSSFLETALVSDGAATPYLDPKLVNGWGIAFNPTAYVWVANAGSATSTLYDGAGIPQALVVATPPSPTGIVYNASADFAVSAGAVTGASAFIFATEGGQIAGWNAAVSRLSTITAYDGGAAGKSYKGLALASQGGANYLYATDFHNARVDVFDRNFVQVTLAGAFVDPTLPTGYAPFGIQAVGNRLIVTYARQDATAADALTGAGLGIVDQFDTAGQFVKRLVSAGGALDAPWGIALAPAAFGAFSNALLIGNFGDGKINAFDATSGALLGTLRRASGAAIVIDGLWGIAFGNGVFSQPTTTLFYAAGPGGEMHGIYGKIELQ